MFAHTDELFLRIGEEVPPPESRILFILDTTEGPFVPRSAAADYLDSLVESCASVMTHLVRRGLPFRDAHEAVGRAVRHAAGLGRDLSELSLEELRAFAPQIGPDALAALTLEGSVAARDHIGGTAPAQVAAQASAQASATRGSR